VCASRLLTVYQLVMRVDEEVVEHFLQEPYHAYYWAADT
jgi:hypothetical protein